MEEITESLKDGGDVNSLLWLLIFHFKRFFLTKKSYIYSIEHRRLKKNCPGTEYYKLKIPFQRNRRDERYRETVFSPVFRLKDNMDIQFRLLRPTHNPDPRWLCLLFFFSFPFFIIIEFRIVFAAIQG